MGNSHGNNRDVPAAPVNWFSASGLSAAGYKQTPTTINRRFLELRTRLINDVEVAGCSRDIAAEIVERNLIGIRKPAHGRAAIHASPEAIALLERDGLLTHRWDSELLEQGGTQETRGFSR